MGGACAQGLEGVARLRASTGLDVGKYSGPFHRRTADDIELPALNADQVSCLCTRLRGAPSHMTSQCRFSRSRPAVGVLARVCTCETVALTTQQLLQPRLSSGPAWRVCCFAIARQMPAME